MDSVHLQSSLMFWYNFTIITYPKNLCPFPLINAEVDHGFHRRLQTVFCSDTSKQNTRCQIISPQTDFHALKYKFLKYNPCLLRFSQHVATKRSLAPKAASSPVSVSLWLLSSSSNKTDNKRPTCITGNNQIKYISLFPPQERSQSN